MKNKKILHFILLTFVLVQCKSVGSTSVPFPYVEKGNGLQIDSIVVSYLDWGLKTRGNLTCDDVREFNSGRNAVYVIKDKELIQSFLTALSLIEMTYLMKKEKDDIRMVLDFYFKNERIKEICLNNSRAIFIDGNVYRNLTLYLLIEEAIPKTTAPY